jgi:hypothetical protein
MWVYKAMAMPAIAMTAAAREPTEFPFGLSAAPPVAAAEEEPVAEVEEPEPDPLEPELEPDVAVAEADAKDVTAVVVLGGEGC